MLIFFLSKALQAKFTGLMINFYKLLLKCKISMCYFLYSTERRNGLDTKKEGILENLELVYCQSK